MKNQELPHPVGRCCPSGSAGQKGGGGTAGGVEAPVFMWNICIGRRQIPLSLPRFPFLGILQVRERSRPVDGPGSFPGPGGEHENEVGIWPWR